MALAQDMNPLYWRSDFTMGSTCSEDYASYIAATLTFTISRG